MASIDHFSRLAAIALLNFADDKGFFFCCIPVIRGELFPFEEDSTIIRGAIDDLSRIGFLECGKTVDGKQVCRIANFSEHQRIDKPQRSEIAGLEVDWDDSKNIPGMIEERSMTEAETETEGKRKGSTKGKEEEIEAIYQAYPKKVAKAQGIKAISRALRSIPAADLLAYVQSFARSCAGSDPQFIPYPATWFNGRRWSDEQARATPQQTAGNLDSIDLSKIDPADLARL